ncbi:hypothetical protein ACFLXP_03830 [Chloroflexota bacterium]
MKNHMAVYLTAIYLDENLKSSFENAYRMIGKRYDAGKSCVRFQKLDELPLSLIGEVIASMSVDKFVTRVKEIKASSK